jgi:hypothetical protein
MHMASCFSDFSRSSVINEFLLGSFVFCVTGQTTESGEALG